jgi:hypothetical protein
VAPTASLRLQVGLLVFVTDGFAAHCANVALCLGACLKSIFYRRSRTLYHRIAENKDDSGTGDDLSMGQTIGPCSAMLLTSKSGNIARVVRVSGASSRSDVGVSCSGREKLRHQGSFTPLWNGYKSRAGPQFTEALSEPASPLPGNRRAGVENLTASDPVERRPSGETGWQATASSKSASRVKE